MPKIDETRPFLAVQIGVMTVSDTRTVADDKSGQTLVDLITRDATPLSTASSSRTMRSRSPPSSKPGSRATT